MEKESCGKTGNGILDHCGESHGRLTTKVESHGKKIVDINGEQDRQWEAISGRVKWSVLLPAVGLFLIVAGWAVDHYSRSLSNSVNAQNVNIELIKKTLLDLTLEIKGIRTELELKDRYSGGSPRESSPEKSQEAGRVAPCGPELPGGAWGKGEPPGMPSLGPRALPGHMVTPPAPDLSGPLRNTL